MESKNFTPKLSIIYAAVNKKNTVFLSQIYKSLNFFDRIVFSKHMFTSYHYLIFLMTKYSSIFMFEMPSKHPL